MSYKYNAGTNQLNWVKDNVAAASYADDIDNNQALNNYRYDAIGNLVRDSAEAIRLSVGGIKWNVYGKITEINKVDSSATVMNKGRVKKISYTYDAAGNRISKKIEKYTTTTIDYTWYVRDASGNVMSTYNGIGTNAVTSAYTLNLTEQHMYGSSRLGIINRNVSCSAAFVKPSIINFTRGNKFFELSNHLQNVLVTVSDKKIGVDVAPQDGIIDYYNADVVTANDYYPFGMQMPGRKYQQGASSYRYGFGGQEKSNEIKGEGNSYTAEFWEYDPRLGRRWNVDPVKKPFESPYVTFSNNPINRVDIHGNSDSTVKTPNGGTLKLPDGAKITGVHNTNKGIIEGVRNGDGTQAEINVTKGSVFRFEFNGDTYNSLYNISDGSFVGYGKNGSDVASIGDLNSKIIEYKFGTQKPDTKTAYVMALGVAESPTPVPPQAKAVAAVVTAATVAALTTITVQTIIHDLQITAPAIVTGGYVYTEKTLNDLVPGSIKRSPSWDDGYGYKTPSEIKELAKSGDKVAQKMKKLWEQVDRLLQKNKNK